MTDKTPNYGIIGLILGAISVLSISIPVLSISTGIPPLDKVPVELFLLSIVSGLLGAYFSITQLKKQKNITAILGLIFSSVIFVILIILAITISESARRGWKPF